MLPDILVDMNAFVDGEGFVGRANELKPPKVTKKMSEVFNGGMAAPVKVAHGYEALQAELSFQDPPKKLLKLMENNQLNGVPVRLLGTYHNPNSQGGTFNYEVVLTGTMQEMDPGAFKRGEQPTNKYIFSASYYRVDIEGETVIEIDAMKPFKAAE